MRSVVFIADLVFGGLFALLILFVFARVLRAWWRLLVRWPSPDDPGLTAGTVVPLVRGERSSRVGCRTRPQPRHSARDSIF